MHVDQKGAIANTLAEAARRSFDMSIHIVHRLFSFFLVKHVFRDGVEGKVNSLDR
jgi:hypothetical protein